MLFLNSPKSHHYGNSSTTICFFLWLLGRVHILTNCEENPVRAGALLHPVQLSSINTCTAPVPWPVQPKFPSQSCLGLFSGFSRPNAESSFAGQHDEDTEQCLPVFLFHWYLGWGGEHIHRGLAAGSAELCAPHPFALSPFFSQFCWPPAIPITYFHTGLKTWPSPIWGCEMKLLIMAPIALVSCFA